MNFKAQVERDLTAVFHNAREHADVMEFWIDGVRYKGPVIIDDGGAQDRKKPSTDHVDGLVLVVLVVYVPLSMLKTIPQKVLNMEIADHIYPTTKAHPEAGDIVLYLEMHRMITITAEQIERVNLILSGVPGGIEKALSSTIRRANNTVRSETLKGITTVYAITRQNVRAETTIKVRTQSSDGGIVGTVLFAGHKIPLYRFNVSPTIPIQRATVSAAVLAGNGRTPFQDAFIARMQSGHTGMFERDGSKRLPISEFMGPSTAQMAGNSIVLADVEEKAQEVINKRVEHEITRILNGYGG